MHHDFYRGKALRAEVRTRGRMKSVIDTDEAMRWDRTQIDLRHQLKASSPAIWCMRVLTNFGVAPQISAALLPVLLHVEALVYRGDFEYEDAQLEGKSAEVDPEWRYGIEEILRTYEINTPEVLGALTDLQDYFQLESAIMEGQEPLDATLIERTCYLRCSGGTLLLRVGCALAEIDYDEHLFTLIGHMSAHDEISTDLPSYQQDIDEGQFNVYRLATWVYGPDTAEINLRRRADSIISDLKNDVRRADRKTLAQFAGIIPPITPWDPRLPSVIQHITPRAILARMVIARIGYHEHSHPLTFPAPSSDTPPRRRHAAAPR
ncbi:hypothetical protein [Nocardia salmonicida]|uniref:hypothetical protein n=1 Tax=Nocardia salmonicida TaxID=53431 RepID=UPI00363142C3